jgi:hypothetical protein
MPWAARSRPQRVGKPVDLSEAIESLQSSLDVVPAAIAAIIFLAGPTVAWIIYRVVVLPRTSRYTEEGGGLLWMCVQCRSANEVRDTRCYRCGLERTAIAGDLHIVDGDEIVALAPDAPPASARGTSDPVPVMDAEAMMAPQAEPLFLAAARPIRPTAMVGPANTPPSTPRRIVVAGPGHPPPDDEQTMVPVGPGKTATPAGKATSPKS